MKISRVWAMPNKETFTIKPINELISKYINKEKVWVDPFVRNSIYKDYCKYTNDLNSEIEATHNLEALDFLKLIKTNSVDGVLFDPPYSFRQIKECYNGIGLKVHQSDTQGSYYSKKKEEVSRIVKRGGIVISFGWNSGGMAKSRGFEIQEILMVPHGGSKHDTLCTVDRKL